MSTNKSRIFVTGDCHGDIDFHKLNSTRFPQGKELTKNDYVIVCGDFGAVWDGGKQDKYLQDWYKDKPWTTLFIDGNHENHFLLNSYPVEKWNGGNVHKINDSIIHLMRGQYYEIGGGTFWTMGGANSHDKAFRKEWVSWWATECPSYEEMDLGIENLAAHGNKVDFILTHEAPQEIISEMYKIYRHDNVQSYLEHIYQLCDFSTWFYGHHHQDRIFVDDIKNAEIIGVYNEIWEF